MENETSLIAQELGRRGGKKTLERYGKAHFNELARKAAKARKEKKDKKLSESEDAPVDKSE